jgi:hypothetical protein
LPDDSSESHNYSPVPYGERDALRFKAERDESRCELGEVSKKACIVPLSCNFEARDAELDQLKMLVQQLADKVNAPGDTQADRLAAVENRVDEVALHGVRQGTTLGLAAMATHTGVNYSMQLRGFQGGAPEGIDEIEVILERLDGHGDAIAEIIHPQSVLNRLLISLY